MTSIEFPAFAFDAVTAFYSIMHIPRDRHAPLLKRLTQWLRPGGWFLASFGAAALDDWVGNWLGTTMFFVGR
jgi:SAM-dependent methyltransferase